jgi:hypothetical protein
MSIYFSKTPQYLNLMIIGLVVLQLLHVDRMVGFCNTLPDKKLTGNSVPASNTNTVPP